MKNFKLALPLLLLFATIHSFGQPHWESLVLESDTWAYSIPTTAPSTNWIDQYFDDRNWSYASGGFGFADGDDNTTVPEGTTSIYLRKSFSIPSDVPISALVLDIDYDDAFVAYLNGEEVARSSNLAAGEVGITPVVSVDHEAQLYQGGTPERYFLDHTKLVSGYNILAVQIINISNTSSDLSGRIFLNAKVETNFIKFNETPSWFTEPTYSTLPIIFIDTDRQSIPDEPKVMANMKIVNNPKGFNYFVPSENDSLEYDGAIGIELRGNTAMTMPKKSYTVETRNADSTNNNVSLFGMPKENDWVLHGPYADKTMMRNALAYYIGNGMGHWNPRTQFVELVINNEYKGVYLFVEKIKIDDDRVDIARLKPEDIEGDQVTGGYILSIDRENEGSWNSQYIGSTGTYETTFSFVDPKYDELQLEQQNYIKAYIDSFETALIGDEYLDEEIGYRKYVDVKSFIDYLIITETSKDIDGYRVSFFFHKDKDSKGGKLTASPFWDYNLCFGNANFFGGGTTSGWMKDPQPFGIGQGDQGNEIPFWWDKFRTDPYWETHLKYRWEDLRATVMSDASINTFVDSCYDELKVPAERNYDQWNTLYTYIWPNVFRSGTYEQHVEFFRNWVIERMAWLDTQIALIEPAFERNNAPVADAGLDFTVYENTLTTITGVGTDVDGDELTYHWEGPAGVFFEHPDSASTRFIVPSVDKDTTFTLKLTVSDWDLSDSNKVKVTVLNRVSAEQIDLKKLVKVYPNPVTDRFTIQFYTEKNQNIRVNISSITGQLVYSHDGFYSAGKQQLNIQRSDLNTNSNVLFYQIQFENSSSVTDKLIVK